LIYWHISRFAENENCPFQQALQEVNEEIDCADQLQYEHIALEALENEFSFIEFNKIHFKKYASVESFEWIPGEMLLNGPENAFQLPTKIASFKNGGLISHECSKIG